VRAQRVDKPGVIEAWTWGSNEEVTVIRRSSSDEV